MHYENTAYFNFDENPEYRDFFRTTKDVQRILPNLAMASGQDIQKGKTLLIFDEVQDSPEVLNALKYFAENAPEYHVACAGSLLGITLARPSSFPVGKVDFLSLYPMSFTEFLMATGSENLAAYLGAVNEIEPLPDAFSIRSRRSSRCTMSRAGCRRWSAAGRRRSRWGRCSRC